APDGRFFAPHDTFGSREWAASIGAPTTYSGLDPGKRGRFTLPMMDDRRYRKKRPGRQHLEKNWTLTVKGEHAGELQKKVAQALSFSLVGQAETPAFHITPRPVPEIPRRAATGPRTGVSWPLPARRARIPVRSTS